MSPSNGDSQSPDILPRTPDRIVASETIQGRGAASPKGAPIVRARAVATLPPAIGTKLNAISLLQALRHRWALALTLGLLGATLAVTAAWYAVPPARYTARSMLHIASKQPSIIFRTAEDNVDFGTYQRTQLTLIKSRLVLNAALRNPEASKLSIVRRQSDPVAWLEKEIEATFTGEILTISLTSSDSTSLPILINAVTDAYLEEIVDVEVRARRERYEELKKIYTTYQTNIKERRGVLNKLAEQLGANDKATVRLTHQLALESRGILDRELMQLRIDLRKAEAELKVRKQAQAAPAVSEAVVENEVDHDKYILEYRQRISQLENTIARNAWLARKKNEPSVRGPVRELEELRQSLANRQSQIRTMCEEQSTKGWGADLIPLADRVRVLKELERVTAAEVGSISAETQNINKGSLDLERLQDDISHSDIASKKIGDEIEALSVELHAPRRVRVMERAEDPRLEADKRPQIAGIMGLGAFGLIIVSVSLLEYRARRIGTTEEVVYGLGMQLMGTLPALPERMRTRRIGVSKPLDESWSSLLVESIDAARTTLLHASAVESIRAVMITSAVGGEGKTSLSCHLATSLARAGLRTLLLDADLRRPVAHLLLDVPQEPGFSEYLRGEIALDDVIQPTSAPGLWMISAGRGDARAIQALARPTVGKFFSELKSRYDFIIVDTTPLLPVADALLIGQHIDAAICSVLRGVSRVPKVYAASERLQTLGIRVLGVVMAGVRSEDYGSHYGYYRRTPQLTEN